jgi:uncharacterized repeat protein (TIGR03803 family)
MEVAMPNKTALAILAAALASALAFLAPATPAAAGSTEQVLYNFCSISQCADGSEALAGLIFDNAGNLYGTTSGGGAYGYGTVFELAPGGGGTWTETVLYSFCPAPGCGDGAYPGYGSLVLDAAGNLYGTTSFGGAYQTACGGHDCGTVFELSPSGDGTWTETVLHSFGNGTDGREPLSGLIFDAAGNLYGTTYRGGAGARGLGTVFELVAGTSGTWTEKVLHNFCPGHGCAGDANSPRAALILGAAGSLYGTTTAGGSKNRSCGAAGCGAIFRLKPTANGRWKENVLYSFTARGGSQAGLILDAAGHLYGTASETVFELMPGKNGIWTEKALHRFGKGTDGAGPAASLVFDAAGKLYSTTVGGGAYGYGTLFQMTPENGKWTETILHSFDNNGQDGTSPRANVIFDSAGNLYSTTSGGGTSGSGCDGYGCGTVFEITP